MREIETFINEDGKQVRRIITGGSGICCCSVGYPKREWNVQAFIDNIAAPKTLDELKEIYIPRGEYHVEDILQETDATWTAPKWAKIGDIVFFMHSKTANASLTAIRTELEKRKDEFSKEEYYELMEWIYRGLKLHSKYGGKIIAVAEVTGAPEYIENDYDGTLVHWHSNVFAEMKMLCVLDNPIDISEFNDFIRVSRMGAITPVFGDDFNRLKSIIVENNKEAGVLNDYIATPLPLSEINDTNWVELPNDYRRTFMLEAQFRSYYVDYLLSVLGDQKKIFKECRCKKTQCPDTFVDNVIKLNGKYLPVEVKLSVPCQKDMEKQAEQYCHDDMILLEKDDRGVSGDNVYQSNVLVIDTDNVYMYSSNSSKVEKIFNLDDLKNTDRISELKGEILKNLDILA